MVVPGRIQRKCGDISQPNQYKWIDWAALCEDVRNPYSQCETSNFKREDELLHQFREKIKLRPELRVLAPGSLPPQIRPIEDKRHWD